MQLRFSLLTRVTFRHDYFVGGVTGALGARPLPETRRLLDQTGLRFKPLPNGFGVIAETEPGSDPPVLVRPFEGDVLRFLLQLSDADLLAITDVPDAYRPGAEVFYFSNLRDDVEGGVRYLGDPVADARRGDPVAFVTKPVLTYAFDAPTSAATLTLRDLFGTVVHTEPVAFEEPQAHVRLDLSSIPGVSAGRYLLEDGDGGSLAFYYAPGVFGGPHFAVVELWRTTTEHAPGPEGVPAGYRFLDEDEVTGNGEYALGLTARATTWRYVVVKKYDANGIDLADLSIGGAVAFAPPTVEPDRLTFDTSSPEPLRQERQPIELRRNGAALSALPNPGPHTPLQGGAAPGDPYVSEHYVYV